MKNIVNFQDATPATKGELEIDIHDISQDFDCDTFEMEGEYYDTCGSFQTASITINYGFEGEDIWQVNEFTEISFFDEDSLAENLKDLVAETLKAKNIELANHNTIKISLEDDEYSVKTIKQELTKIFKE